MIHNWNMYICIYHIKSDMIQKISMHFHKWIYIYIYTYIVCVWERGQEASKRRRERWDGETLESRCAAKARSEQWKLVPRNTCFLGPRIGVPNLEPPVSAAKSAVLLLWPILVAFLGPKSMLAGVTMFLLDTHIRTRNGRGGGNRTGYRSNGCANAYWEQLQPAILRGPRSDKPYSAWFGKFIFKATWRPLNLKRDPRKKRQQEARKTHKDPFGKAQEYNASRKSTDAWLLVCLGPVAASSTFGITL